MSSRVGLGVLRLDGEDFAGSPWEELVTKDLGFVGRVVDKLVSGVPKGGENVSCASFLDFHHCPYIFCINCIVESLMGPVPLGLADSISKVFGCLLSFWPSCSSLCQHLSDTTSIIPPPNISRMGNLFRFKCV